MWTLKCGPLISSKSPEFSTNSSGPQLVVKLVVPEMSGPGLHVCHPGQQIMSIQRMSSQSEWRRVASGTLTRMQPPIPIPSPSPYSRSTDLKAKITDFQKWTDIGQANFTRSQHPTTAENLTLIESPLARQTSNA